MPDKARGDRGQLEHMQRRHSTLKQQVAALERNRHPTQQQQFQITTLKKQKLAAKDALNGLIE